MLFGRRVLVTAPNRQLSWEEEKKKKKKKREKKWRRDGLTIATIAKKSLRETKSPFSHKNDTITSPFFSPPLFISWLSPIAYVGKGKHSPRTRMSCLSEWSPPAARNSIARGNNAYQLLGFLPANNRRSGQPCLLSDLVCWRVFSCGKSSWKLVPKFC